MRQPVGSGERLSMLHRACKGAGLAALYRDEDSWDVSIFGVARGRDLGLLIASAVSDMPDARPKFAVQAALGLELKEPKLTDRREKAASLIGVSERTLIRDEAVGLRLLDTLLDVRLDGDSEGQFKRAKDGAAASSAGQKRLVKEVAAASKNLSQDERVAFHSKLTAAVFTP